MKTNFFMWLLRKLKIPHQSVGTPNQVCNDPFMEPHGTDSDPFLLTHKHSERECRQKIQEALLYGKPFWSCSDYPNCHGTRKCE